MTPWQKKNIPIKHDFQYRLISYVRLINFTVYSEMGYPTVVLYFIKVNV